MKRYLPILLLCIALAALAEEPVELKVDLSKLNGEIKALHGGNCGPLNYGELTDLSAYHKDLNMPLTRLHDCHWPNPDVVDIHTIFSDWHAATDAPDSYDFRRTDTYLKAVQSPILYRLGESIEHSKIKYYVHPPKGPDKWTQVCVGIIRHYNEGWANGMKLNIKYWEIWNEPENRPAMWSGTDEDYFSLYETAAKAIKARWPDLRIGGPSLGYTGQIKNGKFEPGEFMLKFLSRCKEHSLPLGFFSWHLYTNDPAECVVRAKGIRETLDRFGFIQCESHFNEWNYLPDNDWKPMMDKKDFSVRERYFDRVGGIEGASFMVCALIHMQDAPIDTANYYMCDNQPGFGTFTFHGVPRKNYYALKAFSQLAQTPLRAACTGGDSKLTICAGLNRDKTEARILIGNFSGQPARLNVSGVPWDASKYELTVLDESRNLTKVKGGELSGDILSELKGRWVALIQLKK